MEQKNWSVVRRVASYARYDTDEEVKALNDLYDVYRLYVNFFLPSAKLVSKVRVGAKVRKIYDTPQTPYQRLMASEDVTGEVKSSLKEQFEALNLADLKKEVDRAQDQAQQGLCEQEQGSPRKGDRSR